MTLFDIGAIWHELGKLLGIPVAVLTLSLRTRIYFFYIDLRQ
jgi:hypothetical protein